MTWDDDTQKGYEEWERAHGRVPPPLKLPKMMENMQQALADKINNDFVDIIQKEESMKKEEVKVTELLDLKLQPSANNNANEDPDAIVTNPTGEEPLKTDKAIIGTTKRTRRLKGFPNNVTVVEVKNAYIELFTPKRPEGMAKVTICLFYYDGEKTAKRDIVWPEGKSAMQAMQEHFTEGE